jgi:autotransporter-associated beta strand protein
MTAAAARADFTWDGGGVSDLWVEGDNWVGDVAPGFDLMGMALIFGPTGGAQSPDAGADAWFGIGSMSFTGADASLTLIGSGTLTFDSGATITNDSLFLQTISVDLVATGLSLTIEADTADLVIAGNVDLSDGAGVLLTILGASDTIIDGIISGGGSVTKVDGGTLMLNGANTYTGGTALSAGTIVLGNDAALGTGTLTVTGDGTIESDDDDRTVANTINLALGTTLTVAGANDLRLDGGIVGFGALVIDLAAGDDVLSLFGTSTFSGGTTIEQGTIVLGNNMAFGTDAILVLGDATFRSSADERVIGNLIRIDTGFTLTVTGSADLHLAGTMSGDGALLFDGDSDGTLLTLSGSNDFSGGVTLAQGTLVLGHDEALGTGALTLTGAGSIRAGGPRTIANDIDNGGFLLTIDALSSDLTLDGVISGAGGLAMDADNVLTLNGASTYTGDTLVNAGELVLNGSVAGNVSVAAGALMTGTGSIAGDLVNAGTISPGNSQGTFTVGGNYLQQAGSTLVVELSQISGTSDLLDVAGTATLDAGSTIEASFEGSGYIVSGQTFTIIEAGGGVFDNGALIEAGSATLTVDLVIDDMFMDGDTSYAIEIFRAADAYSDAAEGAVNEAIGGGLDSLVPIANLDPTGDAADLLAELDALDVDAYNDAVAELSPEPHTVIAHVGFEGAQAYAGAISSYLSAKRNGYDAWSWMIRRAAPRPGSAAAAADDPLFLMAAFQDEAAGEDLLAPMEPGAAAPAPDPLAGDRWGVSFTPFAFFSRQDTTGDRIGYDADAYGGHVGFDYRLSQETLAGFGVGYDATNADFALGRGNVDIDTLRFGPYLGVAAGSWYIDASATGIYQQFDGVRSVPMQGVDAAFDDDALGFSGYAATGFRMMLNRHVALRPFASAHFTHLPQGGYAESGGAVALALDDRDEQSFRTRVGLGVSGLIDVGVKIMPSAYAAWEHEFLDPTSVTASFVAGGSPFAVPLSERDRDQIAIGAGLEFFIESDVSAYLRWESEFSGDGNVSSILGGLSLTF